MNVNSARFNRAIFYDKDYQNVIHDSCEQGLLSVGMFHRLHKYADIWDTGSLKASQILRSTMHTGSRMDPKPYCVLRTVSKRVNIRLLREDHFGDSGHQSVALAGVGQEMHEQSRRAIEVLHVLASFRRPVDALKDRNDVELDGEPVIYANLPVCTPIHQLQEDAEPTILDSSEDPNGVIVRFAESRDSVVTTDNIVHFSLAEQLRHADQFRFHKCSGALFRHGQVVKAKLGFRIVEEDGKYAMRIDLLELAIINEDIAQAIAFSNRIEQNTTNCSARSKNHRLSTVAKHSRQEHTDEARNTPGKDSAAVKDFIHLPYNGTF
ncbi:hypothetical protein PENSPDRAFT_668821 [Peniophora sp. CONT]|nr:hypothetical protein PENSPDRAFT_668821 [Peniophora sp. CONT]